MPLAEMGLFTLLTCLEAIMARIFTVLKLLALLRVRDLSWTWFGDKPLVPTCVFLVAPV